MRHRGRDLATLIAFLLVGTLALFLGLGCGQSKKEASKGEETKEEEETKDEDGSATKNPITITLYFTQWTETDAYLVAEKRVIPYTQAVARAAMEELIKGPAPGSTLHKVMPNTVKVLDISISNGVCTLNLSKEILTDAASQVGVSATTEGLVLNAIANTLTEFSTIKKVKLLIEGKSSGVVDGFYIEDFWGHVGLPDYLERNEKAIGPSGGG